MHLIVATAVPKGLLLLLQRLLPAKLTTCTPCWTCGLDNSCAWLHFCIRHHSLEVFVGTSWAGVHPQHQAMQP